MKVKTIPIILIFILFLSSSVFAFTDTAGHWAEESIDSFKEYNIVKGYADDTFKPENYLTRAEVATIINRMTGASKESNRYVPDITRQDWYYSEIRKALKSRVLLGDADGYTHPEAYITREEAVVMISRAFMIQDLSYTSISFYDSNEISSWAKDAFYSFVNLKYITGYDDGTIRPKGKVTRAEFITILNRIFKNVVSSGIYTDNISGNMLVLGKGVTLKNLVINGDLFISEGIKETLIIKNVEVKGNLVIRDEINFLEQIHVNGNKYELFDEADTLEKYVNKEFGIEFSIPKDVKVIQKTKNLAIDYTKENIIIITIEQNDDFYLQGIETIGKRIIKEFDNIYTFSEEGTIGKHSRYVLYDDLSKGASYKCLIIKRDNTVYTLFFNKITVQNLFDNVLATIVLTPAENIVDRENVIYKNNKLNLKFSYREGYVGVDDSYNTGNIYSGDAPLKLFIQVNTITDMSSYSNGQIRSMLSTLAQKEGELEETQTLEIFNNPAFCFKIISDDKLKYSLYITVENNLYNLIFTAAKEDMIEIGEDLFDEIIKSIEI